jgi:ADP-ribose pyrophosphatase YjhB (NUDIX family)
MSAPLRLHTYCSYCGVAFAVEQSWPRLCTACGNNTYRNPLPVAVLLLPVDGGVLTVRRAIPPRQGQLALPGGFIDHGEAWQAAAVRELREEAGIVISASEVSLFDVQSAPDGTVLIFGTAPQRFGRDLLPFTPNTEVNELVVITRPEALAFPLHTRVVERWFSAR